MASRETSSETPPRVRPSAVALPPPLRLLPLVRQFSHRLTPHLLPLPVTPNQITVAGTLIGLLGVYCLSFPGTLAAAVGSALFILSQVLDNCDGEVARLKHLSSPFGRRLDDACDFVTHSLLFIVLGGRAAAAYGSTLWAWLGWMTAFGVLMEYVLSLVYQPAAEAPAAPAVDAAGTVSPFDDARASFSDKVVYVFRVLFDADFCFMLPVFVVGDLLWLLLPAGAIGNQIFWAAAFYENARRYHA